MKPFIYKKNIFDINYEYLKTLKIKCLLFDLDNTIMPYDQDIIDEKTKQLLKKINKSFNIVIFSNSPLKRLKKVTDNVKINFVSRACKPLSFKFKKFLKQNNYNSDQVVLIGDQLLTDVKGASKVGIKTILVDPLNNNEFILTKINRILEVKKLEKLGIKRGNYYE